MILYAANLFDRRRTRRRVGRALRRLGSAIGDIGAIESLIMETVDALRVLRDIRALLCFDADLLERDLAAALDEHADAHRVIDRWDTTPTSREAAE